MPASAPAKEEIFVRFVTRLLVLTCLAAAVLVPAAAAADRMWVGFHDDPELRYDGSRTSAMDLARQNESTVLRTLVEWHKVAPTRPANASDPFDPAYRFDDIDEFVRNAQQRGMEVLITIWGTPQWANGGQKPQAMPQNIADFQTFAPRAREPLLGPLLRLSVRPLLLDLERVEPRDLPRRRSSTPGAGSSARATTRGSPRRATPASRPATHARRSRSARRRRTAATGSGRASRTPSRRPRS